MGIVARYDARVVVLDSLVSRREGGCGIPHAPFGPPVEWPEERDIPVYHNRAVWPFVTAYWLLAARKAHDDAVADLCVASLVRGAALELSNMENFELVTVDTAAPVVDSQRSCGRSRATSRWSTRRSSAAR